MAIKNCTASVGQYGQEYVWDLEDGDTPVAQEIAPGKYSVSAEGDWTGSFQIEMKFGVQKGQEHSVGDSGDLVFTSNKTVNIEIGKGYALPVLTSGSGSAAVKLFLNKIPT